MMYGYGPGFVWMLVFSLVWIALVVLIIWAVVRLVQDQRVRRGDPEPRVDEPEEILARRYARGELGTEEYQRMRAELGERRRPD
ncbi:putative membrane protein [Actinopolyspora alba]|uniref:Putative membrane protein n=1 Tax=Actinopolyspora alba TaxID=673379 RepID=A0A1I1ZDE1_9ACTN|nr:SHOCT domain-containing protein [Actinopolyspora alba]SFE29348.1 putative membrane protein [Actinopolyspora alba]